MKPSFCNSALRGLCKGDNTDRPCGRKAASEPNYMGEPSFALLILLVVVFTNGVSRMITLLICL